MPTESVCERPIKTARQANAGRRGDRVLLAAIVLAFAMVIALSVSPRADVAERIVFAPPTKVRSADGSRRPSGVTADGSGRLAALIHSGAFDAALELVRAASAERQVDWWPQLFGAWAEREPGFARELALSCLAAGGGHDVFRAVMAHWAAIAPADAAAFALELPSGAARAEAFRLTLPAWVGQDPAAAAGVLDQRLDPNERDLVAAALVAGTDLANRPTVTALEWAEQIDDRSRRVVALAYVVREWLQHDPDAAVDYLAGASRLTDAERDALHSKLEPRPAGDRI